MKNGELAIVQRSQFSYSNEKTAYAIWYKIRANQSIFSDSMLTLNSDSYNRWTMFFHHGNLKASS